MRRITYLSTLFTTLVLLTASAAFSAPKTLPEPTKEQCLVNLKVSDMACPMGCSPVVTRAIKTVKGVASVRVIFEDRLARVIANKEACNPKATIAMIDAVKKAGYSCEEAKAKKKS